MSFWQSLRGLFLGWVQEQPREENATQVPYAEAEPMRRKVFVVGPSGGTWLVVPGDASVIGPAEDAETVIGPSAMSTVAPPERGAWDERGWSRELKQGEEVYKGFFQVANRRTRTTQTFPGVIFVRRRKIVTCIADPPPEIKRHPKGPCFTPIQKPWFRLNWFRPAKNVDDAILYMEKILDECINGRKQ